MARLLFHASVFLMAAFGVGHFNGFFMANRAARTDAKLTAVIKVMEDHRADIMGFTPSMQDFYEYFSINFAIMMMTLAFLTFVAYRLGKKSSIGPRAVIGALSMVNLVGMLFLFGSSIAYGIPQGIIACGMIIVLLVSCILSAWLTKPGVVTA